MGKLQLNFDIRHQDSDAVVRLPGSKSMAARALIIDAVARRTRRLENLPECDDTRELCAALEQMRGGADKYDLGAGGTSLRFFVALAAATPGFEGTIDCGEALRRRPLAPLLDALRKLGADIRPLGKEGCCPLYVKGRKLRGGKVDIDGNISSQYASALMMVSDLMEEPLQMSFNSMVSRPYYDMTCRMIELGEKMEIESDWSAASYFYEMALLLPGTEIRIENLTSPDDSLQGDSGCEEIFRKLGVETMRHADGSVVLCGSGEKVGELRKGEIVGMDLSQMPDLVPALAVGMCLAGIKFRIEGIGHLKYKETDRLVALGMELEKIGYGLVVDDDSLSWEGRKYPVGENEVISAHGDHRMAMAFSAAAIRRGYITIDGAECVAKSFPDFFEQIGKLGFSKFLIGNRK